MGTTKFKSAMEVTGALAVGGALVVTGALTASKLTSEGDIATTATGDISLTIDSSSFLTYAEAACTATGGSATYDTCSLANPKSFSGSLWKVDLQVATASDPSMDVDCGVINDAATGTGTELFDSETLGVGVHSIYPGGTEVILGPTERIKCATTSGTGQLLDAILKAWFVEAEI